MSDQTFVTTITKFKSKLGAEAKLIAALKNFDNSNSESWQVISVGENVKKKLQSDMIETLIKADTEIIDKKHSGKFISNLTFDVNQITNLLSNAILTLFKDSLTLVGLVTVMFVQNWKLALISIIMIPLASFCAKTLGKRVGKVTTEAQEISGFLTTYLVELFKNHKLIKIFQKENYESTRANFHINNLKNKNK